MRQFCLTRLTWLIHILFLPSNWNLDKNFALTGELGQAHMAKNISDFPPCGKIVIVVTEFVIFCKTQPFYEIIRMEEFQKYFFRPLFTIIFRPKIEILGTDSIMNQSSKTCLTRIYLYIKKDSFISSCCHFGPFQLKA